MSDTTNGVGERATPLLDVAGLELSFVRPDGDLPVLRGVDVDVKRGEIIGLVGETGAGKSMTARAVLGLLDPSARLHHERYDFDGDAITEPDDVVPLRGNRIGFVPQHPRGSLNPVFSVGTQLTDTVRRLNGVGKREAHEEAVRLMKQVQIPDPERRMKAYPHELSGGMCQRICIAIALAGKPDLVIADEPTTGLDVTIQAEILSLLTDLIRDEGAGGLLITHDIGVVAEVCDRIAVMYAGRIVDTGPTDDLFGSALHPYAALLLRIAVALDGGREPEVIPGNVPTPGEPLEACAFAPRCPRATAVCRSEEPPRVEQGQQHAFCHHPLVPGEEISATEGGET